MFLPIYGEHRSDIIASVPLIVLRGGLLPVKIIFLCCISLSFIYGIIELILQNTQGAFWIKNRLWLSLGITFVTVAVFTVCQQPYAAVLSLCLLSLKGILAIKYK